jgi:4-aminobutyrate aminotransferase
VLYLALERGLSFKVSMGNVLTLSPPLVITPEQMNQAIDILHECLTQVEHGMAGPA